MYVCHNQESVDVCNIKSSNSHILFVGPGNVVSKFPERLTIVRDITYNNLVTFELRFLNCRLIQCPRIQTLHPISLGEI